MTVGVKQGVRVGWRCLTVLASAGEEPYSSPVDIPSAALVVSSPDFLADFGPLPAVMVLEEAGTRWRIVPWGPLGRAFCRQLAGSPGALADLELLLGRPVRMGSPHHFG